MLLNVGNCFISSCINFICATNLLYCPTEGGTLGSDNKSFNFEVKIFFFCTTGLGEWLCSAVALI